MNNLSLMQEIAALAGYTIAQSTGQDAINKIRAQRRVNIIKADIISRYGGKWPSSYREGWLPLSALYSTGTITLTNGSRTVTGSGTIWTTSMKGYKLIVSNQAMYKIASVTNSTTLVLTQPFQDTSVAGVGYNIWQDEYRLYPEVLTIGGFIDYLLPEIATEAWPRDMKNSFPLTTFATEPTVYNVIGREPYTVVYNTGTVSGTINTNILTGTGTSWQSNIEPGFEITIGSLTYHVKKVNSDTELELYQQLTTTIAALTTYTSKGKNALIIRFRSPTNQRIVSYWYWAKDYPFVNDNDEDWVSELYPEVMINGAVAKDYMDKGDVQRLSSSKQMFEDAIKSMKVAQDGAYTGVRTIGYNVPPEARA